MQETQEMQLPSLGWEDPLEEEMATCSSILAWKIPWFHGQRSRAGYSPWSCKDSDTTELLSTHTHTHTHTHTQVFAVTSWNILVRYLKVFVGTNIFYLLFPWNRLNFLILNPLYKTEIWKFPFYVCNHLLLGLKPLLFISSQHNSNCSFKDLWNSLYFKSLS